MEPEAFLGKVVAFHSNENHGVCYGCVVGTDDNFLQIVKYAETLEVSTLETKRRHIAEEDGIICTLQSNLKGLREKCDRDGAVDSSAIFQHTLLQWAKKRLREMEKKEWLYIREANVLSESSKLVCSSVMAIVQNMDVSRDWRIMQRIITSISFIETLCSLDNRPMDEDLYRTILERYVAHPFFFSECCAEESRAVGALQEWITAFLEYQRVHFFATNGAKIKQQIDACVIAIRKAQMRRQKLKKDVQLILSGRLLRRTKIVERISTSSCLEVLDGGFSDEGDSFSQNGRNCNGASSLIAAAAAAEAAVVVRGNTATRSRYKVLHAHSASLDGPLSTGKNEMNADFERRCEQLERDLERCRDQNSLLQQEVDTLRSKAAAVSEGQGENRCLEFKIASLQDETLMLLQDTAETKNTTTSEDFWKCQYQQEQQQLKDVLQLVRNLYEAHQFLLKEHEALSDVCVKVIGHLQTQAKDLAEKEREVSVLQNALTVARRESLLAKSIVAIFRYAGNQMASGTNGAPKVSHVSEDTDMGS